MNIPLSKLVWLFLALMAGGMVLTLPLYKFNWRRFSHSRLFIKILFWVPIFLVFLLVLYLNNRLRAGVLLVLLIAAAAEIGRHLRNTKHQALLLTYIVMFVLFLSHFFFLESKYPAKFIGLVIALALASALADVVAFFFGNYLGKHKLPAALNKNKSWEGVFGEIAGAFIGVTLVNAFVVPVISLWLFLPIGIGCAIGDLANSFVKRKVNVPVWSRTIPGHGGLVDRLSSLAGSVFLVFYFLQFRGIT